MTKAMKSFFVKLLIIALPFLILSGVYFITDPYRVLYHYENYYTPRESQYVALNRDMISTEMLLRNYSVYNYDSYIFGNSRSYFYSIKEWSRHINSNHCFHYNSNAESLYGLVQKIKYLDAHNYDFKNALIVFDGASMAKTTPDKGPLFLKYPLYTHQPWLDFQLEFVKAFFDPRFLYSYLNLKITHKWKGWMKVVLSDRLFDYDVKTNELAMNAEEQKIKADSTGYYERKLKKKIFFKRSDKEEIANPVLKEEQKKLLQEAASILIRRNVNFRIILSPLYEQQKLNPSDLKVLNELFGQQNVFDFSGKNEFTEPIGNFYENSHYRSSIATKLMETAYDTIQKRE